MYISVLKDACHQPGEFVDLLLCFLSLILTKSYTCEVTKLPTYEMSQFIVITIIMFNGNIFKLSLNK